MLFIFRTAQSQGFRIFDIRNQQQQLQRSTDPSTEYGCTEMGL